MCTSVAGFSEQLVTGDIVLLGLADQLLIVFVGQLTGTLRHSQKTLDREETSVALLGLGGPGLEIGVELIAASGLGRGSDRGEEGGGGIVEKEERRDWIGSESGRSSIDEETGIGVDPIFELIGVVEREVIGVARAS